MAGTPVRWIHAQTYWGDKMRLYAIAISATKQGAGGRTEFITGARYGWADSQDEAEGAGIRKAKVDFSAAAGWTRHSAVASEIPPSDMTKPNA